MSFDDVSAMFHTESEKLQNLIHISSKSELSVHEIVETYYQIMNISSMITMLKQQTDSDACQSLSDEIAKTEKLIFEQFNPIIHPQIMQKLAKSIQDTTITLQSNSGEKLKEDIEKEAKLYDELREKMSTKEFVEQYDKGLSND
jgi:hypothetical protein